MISFDYVVLGSGLAGLTLALEMARHGRVALIAKRSLAESNTFHAQGGIASVTSDEDSFERHVHDTLEAGAGLCNERIVRHTVQHGPEAIEWLVGQGVEFTRRKQHDDEYDLGREGGHSKRRVLHVADFTGQAIAETLIRRVRETPNITLFENHIAIDLIMKYKLTGKREDRVCLGVYVLDRIKAQVLTFSAPVTVIATGGAGKVYLYTSNPDTATGDGVAMAQRAGVRVANMEFYQFHPTCLYHPQAKNFLISEALRGEGGVLRNVEGESFMERYHPMGSLAPRDIVARAIDNELKTSGADYVLLDMSARTPEFVRERFPNIYRECLRYGIDIGTQPIPVVPAAHFQCGGIIADEWGRTDIHGLYAVGEAACSGLHGANRLASNSLLEAVTFGRMAAQDARSLLSERPREELLKRVPVWDTGRAVAPEENVVVTQTWDEIRRFMWNFVGIVRTTNRLERAERRINLIRQEIEAYYWKYNVTSDFIELRNIACVAHLIIQSALLRRESRGLHFNKDYPYLDDKNYLKDTVI